jgi:uncharacterized protein (TIGR02145 family)
VTSTPGGGIKSGTGSPLTVTGLTNGTPYTFTVIATNAVGSSVASAASAAVTPAPPPACGSVTSVTIEGYSYPTVSIGTQCWTKENLKVSMYNDGTPIDFDASGGANGNTVPQTWGIRTSGAYTIYANESSTLTNGNASNFGYLYNWYAATDSRKLCPTGWHVPTDSDWNKLVKSIDSGADTTGTIPQSSIAGGKMKSNGTTYWNSPNTGADNASGFTALPGGFRANDGRFINVSFDAFFWSATEIDNSSAWNRNMFSSNSGVFRFSSNDKSVGASVRCLRD